MRPFCPHCGYDLCIDQPIILNDFSMIGPGAPLLYKGRVVRLTGAESNLCWSLMKAYPNPVRNSVLLDRMGSEGTDNTVEVLKCRVRKKIAAVGGPNPFGRVSSRNQGRAVVWDIRAGTNAEGGTTGAPPSLSAK